MNLQQTPSELPYSTNSRDQTPPNSLPQATNLNINASPFQPQSSSANDNAQRQSRRGGSRAPRGGGGGGGGSGGGNGRGRGNRNGGGNDGRGDTLDRQDIGSFSDGQFIPAPQRQNYSSSANSTSTGNNNNNTGRSRGNRGRDGQKEKNTVGDSILNPSSAGEPISNQPARDNRQQRPPNSRGARRNNNNNNSADGGGGGNNSTPQPRFNKNRPLGQLSESVSDGIDQTTVRGPTTGISVASPAISPNLTPSSSAADARPSSRPSSRPASNNNRSRGNASKVKKLKPEEIKDLLTSLTHGLTTSSYECMVCWDVIGPGHYTWSCDVCWAVFHLGCIQKWGISSISEFKTHPYLRSIFHSTTSIRNI
ncbi:hypothetical protein BC937DRAFT_87244 [Endogone sp. FLAS-F59071]|nr:hypothetical protein BC937DRAFT_87244 [Endogone sp. FLAS-F59071]|eukprot:RUS12690.1 hypothetical protein BC937DRAFT_87244 [Endogone sp. FLAS-F59071]